MIRRRSLDSAVSLQEVGTGKSSHGSRKGSLLIIRPPRGSQSLEEAQQQIQELGRSLNTAASLRSQPIEEESPEQPDGLINTTSFVKQNKSFHKLFDELTDGEALTHTFTCALQKDGLYHGKLYLSVNFLCFYSSVLRKDTKVVIPVASVSEVKKHKLNLTMLSVRMATGAKYSFGSLRNREACYKLLQSICSKTQGAPTESANSSPRVSSSAENEVDRDLMSSPSSQSDSVQNSRNNSLSVVDNVFPASPARRSSSSPGSSTVEEEASTMPRTPEDRAGGLWTLSGVFETLPPLLFQKETNHLNAVFSIYLLLLVVLVFTSGYMGLRILALEQQLNALGALAEFSLQYKET